MVLGPCMPSATNCEDLNDERQFAMERLKSQANDLSSQTMKAKPKHCRPGLLLMSADHTLVIER